MAQQPTVVVKDTVPKEGKPNAFKTGFYPVAFFDFDMRYLVKYNNYEGIRLGIGGVTNDKLLENVKIGGYTAYGFKDQNIKYSFGIDFRVNKEANAWVGGSFKNDIAELGSYSYLTDARVYSVFEPRLVNITQFYKHRTYTVNFRQAITPKIIGEYKISRSNITQIETYQFVTETEVLSNYVVSEATAAFRFSPESKFITNPDGDIEYFDGFPKISAQISQGINSILDGDFLYTKLGLKADYYIKRTNLTSTNLLFEANLGLGDIPLTHLFHAFPNSPTKDEVFERFSVAGRRSFETMYFGEFFSDKLMTFQAKHSLRRFEIGKRFRPELVFVTRHALGSLVNKERHLGLTFNTLNKGYHESGFELNKLIFGFGLSFAYRYGPYHLPDLEDNISAKFTFYLSI